MNNYYNLTEKTCLSCGREIEYDGFCDECLKERDI